MLSTGRWGQAKREVIALWPLILQELDAGSSVSRIWTALQADGKVTVSLQKFNEQVRRRRQPANNPPKSTGRDLVALAANPSSVISTHETRPLVSSSPEDAVTATFNHNNRSDASELWE